LDKDASEVLLIFSNLKDAQDESKIGSSFYDINGTASNTPLENKRKRKKKPLGVILLVLLEELDLQLCLVIFIGLLLN
jgi:hypothetical protein